MTREVPRIQRVEMVGPHTVTIHWRGHRRVDTVHLAGWIATGGKHLAPLLRPENFAQFRVANFGSAIAWDDECEMAIDAMHLVHLADEQKPFRNNDVRAWQTKVKISNHEAAALLGVSVSTWNAYKVNAKIPQSVAMVCRATLRDPLMMQAYLCPRAPAGRPRKQAS